MATTISTNNVTTIPSAASSSSTNSTNTANGTLQTTSDQFLKMLVTQMQNQDPLNPMDNSQMTSQIAQLNTVQGINNLNTTVQSLQTGLQANLNLQAASLIGAQVTVPGSSFALPAQTGTNVADPSRLSFGYDLSSAADSVMVNIKDTSGNVVRTMAVNGTAQGTNYINWDGKDNSGNLVPVGTYSFSVAATAAGKVVSSTNLSSDTVLSVSMDTSGVKLNTANLGNVAVSDVRKVQ